MKRVAAYCRVSTDRNDQLNSLESQRRYFQEQIERRPDWVLHDIYADEGVSGTSLRRRTRFADMMRDARAGLIDLILTKEVSRFSRNVLDTIACTRELRSLGVSVVFLCDAIDTSQPESELKLSLLGSLAQEESRRTSARVKWGQTQRMRAGVVFGGPLLGYDVKNGAISVEAEGAGLVREIFRRYVEERKGAPTIARELRETGEISSRGNCLWSAATVLKILKNEKYCGDLVQKKTCTPDFLTHEKKINRGQETLIRICGHHEPIVSRAVFEKAQEEMRRRAGKAVDKGRGNRYPLSGKLVCAVCGSSFRPRKRTGAGGPYVVWRCGKASDGGAAACTVGRQLRGERAIELIGSAVSDALSGWETAAEDLAAIFAGALDADGEAARLERGLRRADEKKRRAVDAYLSGALDRATFMQLIRRCREEIEACRTRLNALPELDTALRVKVAVSSVVSGEGAGERFLGSLLGRMTVFPDGRVEVALEGVSGRWTFALPPKKAKSRGKRGRISEFHSEISRMMRYNDTTIQGRYYHGKQTAGTRKKHFRHR